MEIDEHLCLCVTESCVAEEILMWTIKEDSQGGLGRTKLFLLRGEMENVILGK